MSAPMLVLLPATSDTPHGFRRVRSSPGFMTTCGEFYVHESAPILATRITTAHLNAQDIVHGGFLATLADSAYGMVLRRTNPELIPRTAQLSVSYLGAVCEGDFVEARVTLHKIGKRLVNGSCDVYVGDRMVLQTTAVFSVVAA
ncbi:uncharacterized protein (TIGR00369 family) [Cupriavidus metallidurans]|jgi:uncharacterized protein (TIGR00369 family)|uniref:PaaI family thioesterase n=1 Tax=Cupriavidus metallidurans TaxID=119219 RepID=UPI0004936B0E|nr:PaaI family thioesterase [Cupriavidus metallidurans]AVA34155.1 PaaI family thioesterase [Cupriavidus metallidurans]KWW34995.1 hypothetical protein AU374_03869 [Cupriavidus metallidurans]MDE4922202.1 PaaI family thioesterase [Cupriavidus metallidurans]